MNGFFQLYFIIYSALCLKINIVAHLIASLHYQSVFPIGFFEVAGINCNQSSLFLSIMPAFKLKMSFPPKIVYCFWLCSTHYQNTYTEKKEKRKTGKQTIRMRKINHSAFYRYKQFINLWIFYISMCENWIDVD